MVNQGAVQLASAIFKRYPTVGAVVHSHSHGAMTLMALGQEMKFVSEPSFLFWNRTSYLHADYFFDDAYANLVAEAVAKGSIVVAMKNHAFLMVGATVEEVWLRSYMFEQAAAVQISMNADPVELSEAEHVYHASSYTAWNGNAIIHQTTRVTSWLKNHPHYISFVMP